MKMRLNSLALAVLGTLASAAWSQSSVEASAAESGRLWFVELSGAPVADGNSAASVQGEKRAFRRAAAGVRYSERRAFDVLFNGFAVEVDASELNKLRRIGGVKAVYPIETLQAPTPEQVAGSAPDLVAAISLTGAKAAQDTLGLTGRGVKVGIIDSGIDVDHPAFGGTGVRGTTAFPNARVYAGYDFVGDAFHGGNTPAPDGDPRDCPATGVGPTGATAAGGHGTHVAGIVGANGGGIRGVAPQAKLAAYRVFGCYGSTTADIMLAAMELALADGVQVINQSIGSRAQWPQYPTGQAASRLVNMGVVMVASIGNNGPGGSSPDALFAAGAPGVGEKVIGVASFDNAQRAFTVNGTPFGYNAVTGSPLPPTSGSLPMSRTGTPTTTNDACSALPAGSLAGTAALIRRGTCSFYIKASNAQAAGAAAVVLYNNAAGALNATVAGVPAITIPVVGITADQGFTLNGLIAAGPTTLTWTDQYVGFPFGTGGLISGFSSFGLGADLSFKPDIGAPGGGIYSTYPLELGGAATLSGTSMSSPHVAGGIALILEAKPNISSNGMAARIQNTAQPKPWSGNAALGFLDHAFRQGAGMLDILATVQATTRVEPSEIAVGESEGGPKTFNLKVTNESANAVTYALGHTAGVAAGPNTQTGASYALTGVFDAPATVSFSAASVVVPAKGSATVSVTIDANAALPDRSLYGGYVQFTSQTDGKVTRVPYGGFKGDYQSTVVLTPTANGFPWLAQLNAAGTSYLNRTTTGGTYSMVGADIPYFLMHLDHHSRRIRVEAFAAASGQSLGRVSEDEYVPRNTTPGGFFAFTWDGYTFRGKGKSDSQWALMPNGSYIAKVSVLKALGDEANPAHWETWTSPVITIARP